MKKTSSVSVIMGLMILWAIPTAAAPVFFTDRTAFDAASGGGLSFESFEADFSPAASVVFADFTVSETGGINALAQLRDFPGLGLNAVITDGTGGLFFDDNGTSIGTFFAFSSPINAFGIDLVSSPASTVTIGGSVSSSVTLAAGVPKFFGVIDLLGSFTSISFDASGGPNIGFDAASYGAVPEPSTLALATLGLLGIGYGRRKRS
jgi:PEP-CTERM motif